MPRRDHPAMGSDWVLIAFWGLLLIALALAAVAGGRLAARLFMRATGPRER